MKKSSKLKIIIFSFLIGFVNGLFGAGGGLIAVPFLKSLNFNQKKAHANSIAITMLLCILSSILYFTKHQINPKPLLTLIPFGLIGAFLGTLIMKKINEKQLKLIFCLLMIYSGVRMFF